MNRFVLMLEGDGDDQYLTEQILSELDINISVKFLSNSTELFNFLSPFNKPVLILIDYNSIPDNGVAVLKKLKSNTTYNDIPL